MPITPAELIFYSALLTPNDDTSAAGGAIDVDARPVFTPLASNSETEVLSDNAGDVGTGTVIFRDATGTEITEAFTLTGTTAVIIPNGPAERIQDFTLDADAAGIITLRVSVAGATIGTVPIGERRFYRMFRGAVSSPAPEVRYAKGFSYNAHPTLTLENGKVTLTADPAAVIFIGGGTKGGTVQVANRKTPPGAVTFVNDGIDILFTGNTLEALTGFETWVRQDLAADNSPITATFTVTIAGDTV